MGTTIETTRFVGMDFNDPDVDVQKIAAGLGARTQKIDSLGAIGDVLTKALGYSGPSFLVIDREP
jgi:benzoylformate decarboxylase